MIKINKTLTKYYEQSQIVVRNDRKSSDFKTKSYKAKADYFLQCFILEIT